MNRWRLAPIPWALLLLVGAGQQPLWAGGDQAPRPADQRPPGLQMLLERPTMQGTEYLGVFGAGPNPRNPELRQIKVWLETPVEAKVRTETIGCTLAAPMRLTLQGSHVLLKELNPGGAITPSNRLDYQIWWAACYPEQTGKDPELLRPLARRLGYSGRLIEREQVLPGTGR